MSTTLRYAIDQFISEINLTAQIERCSLGGGYYYASSTR